MTKKLMLLMKYYFFLRSDILHKIFLARPQFCQLRLQELPKLMALKKQVLPLPAVVSPSVSFLVMTQSETFRTGYLAGTF